MTDSHKYSGNNTNLFLSIGILFIAERPLSNNVYEYPDKTIKLIALNCLMISDKYEVLEHEQIAWIKKRRIR